MIRNPILKGFNADPSICRAGNDYYIATSTFEWYPGVQIHHSRDLVNWRLVKRPLERASQLDMRGNPDSGGVWAPCLSHADGRFWLIYTDVKRLDGNFKDAHNYLVTAPADHRPVVRPDLPELLRLRPLAVPRRRRPQVARQPAVEAHHRQRRRPPARHRLRRHPLPGIRPGRPQAHRPRSATSSPARPTPSSRARTSSSATAGTT